jgi:tetratricopeptide (TPR) repeat protein
MGVVYRAIDTRLRREVAVKVLPPDLVSDEDRRRRFVQEAQAAAALQHPNIAVVHEIDEADGTTFIVMELVAGESLKELIDRGPVPIARLLPMARQIADGLSCAHEKGIVHRDLKPANVMVLESGQIKIIDFGLAKLIEPVGDGGSLVDTALRRETRAGTLLGTISYMSPEQARGHPVDHRSDLFSLGVVLYEMATGRHPFERATAADTLSAILKEEPARPTELPKGVRDIVERCLAKSPDDRFSSASELARALQMAEAWVRKPRAGAFAAAAALVIALVAGTWWLSTRERRFPAPPPEIVSILIADFDNQTGETVFDGAIEQAVAISLEGAPFITAFDRARARQLAATLAPDAIGKLDVAMARLVCRSQGIELALTGRVEAAGSGYHVHLSAVDPVTAEILADASERVAEKAGILAAVDRLASNLRGDLGDVQPASRQAFQDETFTTSSLEAMHAYAAGQDSLNAGDSEQALRRYGEAISHDEEFGRAYTGIGVALLHQHRNDEAGPYFEKALSLLHRMTDRERLLTRGIYYIYAQDYPKAIDEYTELARAFPSEDLTNLALAYFYTHDFEKAWESGQRSAAATSTPLSRVNSAIYATYAGRFDEAIRGFEAAIEESPDYHLAHVALGLARLANGEPAEADEAYRRLGELGEQGASLAALGLADLALYEGRMREAERILSAAVEKDLENEDGFAAAQKLSTVAELQPVEAAPDTAERALSLSQDIGTRYRASMTHLRAGDRERAQELIDALAREADAESRTLAGVLRAETSLLDDDPKSAIATLLESRAIADTWLGRFALGRAYLASGSFVEASSELETCLRRRGEATALFLDDVPSHRIVPEVYYYLAKSHEGLKSLRGAA